MARNRDETETLDLLFETRPSHGAWVHDDAVIQKRKIVYKLLTRCVRKRKFEGARALVPP